MTSKGTRAWVMLYTHIAQLMTHATNVCIAASAAYLAVMLLSLLAYCRG